MATEHESDPEPKTAPTPSSGAESTAPAIAEAATSQFVSESGFASGSASGSAPASAFGAASVPEVAGNVDLAPAATVLETYQSLDRILEALLLAADQALSLDQMQRLLTPELNLSKPELREALAGLAARLDKGATHLVEVASGFRVQVRGEFSPWVSRLWQEKPAKFSRAALETLALVVYRQPITRGEIEDVRGVAVSTNILRGLLERGWIREVGHKEVPGRPALFATTAQFLDDFGLKSLDQLPSLPDIKDVEQLELALARLGVESGEAVAQGEDAEDAIPVLVPEAEIDAVSAINSAAPSVEST